MCEYRVNSEEGRMAANVVANKNANAGVSATT